MRNPAAHFPRPSATSSSLDADRHGPLARSLRPQPTGAPDRALELVELEVLGIADLRERPAREAGPLAVRATRERQGPHRALHREQGPGPYGAGADRWCPGPHPLGLL